MSIGGKKNIGPLEYKLDYLHTDSIMLTLEVEELIGIYVDKQSLDLEVGENEQLIASAIPPVEHQPSFQWSSANESVATVNSRGLVEALSAGETILKVRTSDISTSVPVMVNPRVSSAQTYSDTIIKISLKGDDCPFADHADYGVYIPTRTESLRGVMILQHGCGVEQFGITRPYDLQYQAFARKWKLAIIETAIYGDCGLWRDPSAGTADALFKVLKNAGNQTGHSELNAVPWILWGHSAGGYWALAMIRDYPERIVAAVCYSAAWDPKWDYPKASVKIPILMRHAGASDGDPSVRCWATATNTFLKLRQIDAPICIAHNRGQNHNFSYIRYMAIPFFEAAMKQRMPGENATELREMDCSQMWLGDTLSLQLFKASDYSGDKSGMCLFPDKTTAKNWKEFISTGKVADKTPPPAPYNVKVKWMDKTLEVTWNADADIESGILKFQIFKNDTLIGTLPQTESYQYFDTNGDNTIPVNVPEMKFRWNSEEKVNTAIISVQTVNHFNLESTKTKAVIQ